MQVVFLRQINGFLYLVHFVLIYLIYIVGSNVFLVRGDIQVRWISYRYSYKIESPISYPFEELFRRIAAYIPGIGLKKVRDVEPFPFGKFVFGRSVFWAERCQIR